MGGSSDQQLPWVDACDRPGHDEAIAQERSPHAGRRRSPSRWFARRAGPTIADSRTRARLVVDVARDAERRRRTPTTTPTTTPAPTTAPSTSTTTTPPTSTVPPTTTTAPPAPTTDRPDRHHARRPTTICSSVSSPVCPPPTPPTRSRATVEPRRARSRDSSSRCRRACRPGRRDPERVPRRSARRQRVARQGPRRRERRRPILPTVTSGRCPQSVGKMSTALSRPRAPRPSPCSTPVSTRARPTSRVGRSGGWSFDGSDPATDPNGHGTHEATIAAGGLLTTAASPVSRTRV